MGKFKFDIRLVVVIASVLIQGGYSSNIPKAYPPMGKQMRAEFLHDPNYTPLNHGAYGTFPNTVKTALREIQDKIESNADHWIRIGAREELDKVRVQIAALLGCSAEDIVVVPNTTSGINAILRSMKFQPGDKIMHFSTVYGSMKSLIDYICDNSNGTITSIELPVTYPISNDELIQQFQAFVTEHHRPDLNSSIRLALYDHVTSVPHVINPIDSFTSYLRSRNILTLIDGAHAVGQVPINIRSTQPDFYITNAHKWLYSARSAALLYVAKERQSSIHPAVISSNYDINGTRFQDEFFWTGTIDYSPYMTIPAAIKFRQDVGGEQAIMNYTHTLAMAGGKYLVQKFGTRVIQQENQIGSCIDVQLPIDRVDHPSLINGFWDTELFSRQLFTGTYTHGGHWWIRISAQIYTDMDDFIKAGEVFGEICDELNRISGPGTMA